MLLLNIGDWVIVSVAVLSWVTVGYYARSTRLRLTKVGWNALGMVALIASWFSYQSLAVARVTVFAEEDFVRRMLPLEDRWVRLILALLFFWVIARRLRDIWAAQHTDWADLIEEVRSQRARELER